LVPGQVVEVYAPKADGELQVINVAVEQRWFFKRVDEQ